MKRTAKEWAAFNPVDVVWPTRESTLQAFRDAQADILKMAKVLRVIGYPESQSELDMTASDIAEYICGEFGRSDLDENV